MIWLSLSYDHEVYLDESIMDGALSYEEVCDIRKK